MPRPVTSPEARSSSQRSTQSVTREQVVAAALRTGDEEGLDALSIRRVAAEVGLSPMSVYKFIDSKDDLLDAVVLSVIDRVEVPFSVNDDWRERIVEVLRAWRQVIEAHPCVVDILALRRIPPESRGLGVMAEHVLGNLEQAGVEDARAVTTFWHLLNITFGFVLFERARSEIDEEAQARAGEQMHLMASRHGFTRVERLAQRLTTIHDRGSSDDAVRTHLRGLESGETRTDRSPLA